MHSHTDQGSMMRKVRSRQTEPIQNPIEMNESEATFQSSPFCFTKVPYLMDILLYERKNRVFHRNQRLIIKQVSIMNHSFLNSENPPFHMKMSKWLTFYPFSYEKYKVNMQFLSQLKFFSFDFFKVFIGHLK